MTTRNTKLQFTIICHKTRMLGVNAVETKVTNIMNVQRDYLELIRHLSIAKLADLIPILQLIVLKRVRLI